MLNLFRQMTGAGVESISAAEAKALLKDSNTVFIDVREPYEYSGNHIAKAKNIPLGQLSGRMSEINKDKQVVVICASGARSMRAASTLSAAGYNVKNMSGGMSSWS